MTVCRPSHLSLAILPIILIFLSTCAIAELATKAEMEQVCQNWLAQSVVQRGGWAKSTVPEIVATNELVSDNGVVLARYYSISPTGFVLIPTLKEMRPIKAYSDESILDERQEGGFLLMIKEMLQARFELYEQEFGDLNAGQSSDAPLFDESQRELWDVFTIPTEKFLSLRQPDKDYLEEGGPLLTSSWHQHEPYNNDCPMGDGGRTIVGCVAIATSQILNYWKWPEQGVGSHSYYWSGDYSCGGSTYAQLLYASYSDSYDWAHIIDSCDEGCLSADSAALANLCYEVGVALDMDYGVCGSSSYTSFAAFVFPYYFKYSYDIAIRSRKNYSLPGWYNTIKEEIASNRVAQYRVSGHSIVADGYRSDGTDYEYHMNYGWGGSFTTWFVFDNLYCSSAPGQICQPYYEYVIINIYPQDSPILQTQKCIIYEFGGNGDWYGDPGDTMYVSLTVENLGIEAVNPYAIVSTDDPYLSIFGDSMSFNSPIPQNGQSSGLSKIKFIIDTACPDSHYSSIHIHYFADGGYASVDTVSFFIGNAVGFSDDMESGCEFWTHQRMTPAFQDEWHTDTYRSHSGTTSWKSGGLNGNEYSDILDGGLITPPFLLPVDAQLTFWHWIDAETDDSISAVDGALVMFRSNEEDWVQITPDGGYPYVTAENEASPFETGTSCFSGTSEWEQLTFDLSSFSGMGQVLFRFGSDGATTQEGWYIDDIQVTGGYRCGDANGDLTVNVGDAVFLISYIFKSGPAPVPVEAGDADGSGGVNVGDVVYLINYVFRYGPPPVCP
ncbi:MAG: C10 family peptidase [Candidatus Zixiibacteriota bacterium]